MIIIIVIIVLIIEVITKQQQRPNDYAKSLKQRNKHREQILTGHAGIQELGFG